MNLLKSIKQFFSPLFYRREKPIVTVVDDGLILETPKLGDYRFGGETEVGAQPVLAPDADWTFALPGAEWQKKRAVETMACVSFSALSILEMIAKAKFSHLWNKSDRFTAKMSGTGPSGNTFTRVGDSIRKDGSVNESDWPFSDDLTWDVFYKDIPETIKKLGQNFLKEYKVQYEWVSGDAVPLKSVLKEALKYSPLQIAVAAWHQRSNGLYYSPSGIRQNHATILIGFKEEEYWEVFDSYEPFVKKLEWDFAFYPYAFKYTLSRLVGNTEGEKLYERLLGKLIIVPGMGGELYRVNEEYLSKIVISIGDRLLLERTQKLWAADKTFLGVGNKDFETLKSYYVSIYGSVRIE